MSALAKRWWRPELMLVVGIPLLTIAGGAWTLHAVQGDLSADGEHASVRRTAQVQTAELAPDLEAAREGLSAQMLVDRARGEVRVSLPRGAAPRKSLQLDLLHNLSAERDLHVRLRPVAGAWVGKLDPDAGSRWRVVLSEGQRWRLVGTLPRGGAALSLQPALAPP